MFPVFVLKKKNTACKFLNLEKISKTSGACLIFSYFS